MGSKARSSSYSRDEDIHLCHVYLEITQDPIIGINQSKERMWSRVMESYNTDKPSKMQERGQRSLECRMKVIIKAVKKFRFCIHQVEKLNPSGASDQDILNKATELLMLDKDYAKGFKFDHVWSLLKDLEIFAPTDGGYSPQSETQPQEYPTAESGGLSGFSIKLSDDNVDASSSQRPAGVKKSKLKRKQDDSYLAVADAIREETQQLVSLLANKSIDRRQSHDLEMKRLELAEQKEENKILLKDLDSISDPNIREYFRNEQMRIWQKRAQKEQSNSQNYFNDLGGSGADLPDY